MTDKPDKPAKEHVITRERLLDGSLAERFRANAPPGYRMRSEEELITSLNQTLENCPQNRPCDIYVFGYGSLMWNPAIEYEDSVHAHLHGYSRRFCLRLHSGRGSMEKPGVMLALDRGGSCHGLALRLCASKAEHELRLLWRREMLSHAYQARWVTVRIAGNPVTALTFVINRESERYLGDHPVDEIVEMLLTGEGHLGTSHEYFEATRASLRELGVRDSGLDRLHRRLEERLRVASVSDH